MKRFLFIYINLLAFALMSTGQTWDFVNYNIQTRTIDEQGNQYLVSGRPSVFPSGVWLNDSLIKHSLCCSDTLNATYNNYKERQVYQIVKLNAAGKKVWQSDFKYNGYITQIKVINKEIYLLTLPRGLSDDYKDYSINRELFPFSDSFLTEFPDPNLMIHLSESGEFIEQTLLFTTQFLSTHFDLIEDDYVFYLHGAAKLMDGRVISGENQTKVFRMNKQGDLKWVIEKPRYYRYGLSKFTKTEEAIYFFTRDTITVYRNAPRFYKADFDGNLLDSTNIISSKIGFNYFVNMDSDSKGNVYALGYIVEPVVIDGVPINTEPFVKKPLLLKLDKDLNYVWHRVLCDSNLQDVYLVTISPNDAIWCHIDIEKEGSSTNEIKLTGRSQWIKYNTNGDLVEVLDRPNTTPAENYDDYYAEYNMVYETLDDEVYVVGGLIAVFNSNPQIHFDDFTIRTPTEFTAKRNRKLLNLSKDNISCINDSLELAFDPVYKKFEWYLTDSSCTIPMYEGKKIRPNNLSKGKYPVLVRAYVNDSLYWCMRDTFEVIEKPIANFTAQDTIVCAYSAATFTNQSTTDTINATNGEKWVWTFGDGETKTVSLPFGEGQGGANPPPSTTHVYTRPGTYTVSLFYSNGFCDSTLTKNQYITVVDAPAPGFTVDNIRGCSPFTVNVTDTVTKNTIRKEYNYYDGRGWIDVPVNQVNFSQTYPDAGTYWITQRLYGYTGCVTQLDSVQVFVTPGFTAFDTSHITNATYQDIPAHPKAKEIVTLTWPCLEDAAVRYHLYRNNEKIAELDAQPCVYVQMFYEDSLAKPSKSVLTYTVLALDSCGTATQLGRVGQPVHLTGEVVGNNELSIIRYTAYQDWNVGAAELSYDLQTEAVLGDWKTIKQENSTADYRDYQFLDATKAGIQLEKCYRVIARLGGSKSTISNILCLPYSPVIFIPTAFSPNGDNLNDVYRPITFGITQYAMSIYDRYGQKVAELNQDSAGWDAADYPIGTYMITLRAKGTDSKWYNAKETVTVVR